MNVSPLDRFFFETQNVSISALEGGKAGVFVGAAVGDARRGEKAQDGFEQEAIRRAEIYRQQQEYEYHQQQAATQAGYGTDPASPHETAQSTATLPRPVYPHQPAAPANYTNSAPSEYSQTQPSYDGMQVRTASDSVGIIVRTKRAIVLLAV